MANVSPKQRTLFLLGAVAPLSMYVVFYATHAQALITQLKEFYSESGLLGICVTAVLFLGVAALCGGWALWCDSKTCKAAFSAGLGLPALILSGSGAFGPAANSAWFRPTSPVQLASLAPVPMFAAAEPGVLSKAFGLVFNPVGTVVRGQTAALEQRTVTLQQQTAMLQETNATLFSQQQVVQTRLASLEDKLEVEQRATQAAATSARTEAARLTQQMTRAQADMAERETRIKELNQQNTEYERAVTGLNQQIEETQRKLAASGGDEEFFRKEIKRLTAEQKSTVRELDRLLTSLAKVAGPKAADVLGSELPSVQSEATKISIIRAIGAVPRAVARDDIRKQLMTLGREGSPDVQKAVKGVLPQ